MKYSDEVLIQYLEGELDEATTREIRDWLKADASGKKRLSQFEELIKSMDQSVQYSPDPSLDWEFRSALTEASKSPGSASNWMRIAAAAALLVVGFSAGSLIKTTADDGGNLLALERQITQLQQLVMQQKLQNYSPSERLRAVNQIEEIKESPNEELIRTLIATMTQDESPNVRYAAIQALSKFIHEEAVRQSLVRSLEHQEDALIQIAIINLLVEADEKTAIAPMKKIIKKESTSEEVVRQAQIAIDILI